MHPEWGLGGLALSAFLSATLLPGGSEVLLAWLAQQHYWRPVTLLGTAAIANTLGGLSTYGVGRVAAAGRVRAGWNMRVNLASLTHVRRWGYTALLFSWLPVVGDGLCLAAGWLRLHPLATSFFLFVGKLLRYAAVLWLVS